MMWRRLDCPGHEWARLSGTPDIPILRGTAVFLEDRIPGRLDYRITCDSRWKTSSVDILGWVGGRKIRQRIERSGKGAWTLDGRGVPEVEGCDDLDLSFSPATNLLPIRRLGLAVGEEAEVRAAWLKFPGMGLEPLTQRFRRISERTYAYASDNGFRTELVTDAEGFVVEYPPLWTRADAE